MKFLKSKFVIILIIFILIIISGGFFLTKQINKNFLNFINQSSVFNGNIKLGKIKSDIYFFKNEIQILNSSINLDKKNESKNEVDFYRQIYIPKLRIKLNFFQIFQLIFSKNSKIKKIILENPSFNFNLSEDGIFLKDFFIDETEKTQISLEIVDGYLRIQNKEKSFNQNFDNINGSFNFNSNKLVETKLIFKNQENFYEFSVVIERLKTNFYNFKSSLKTENDILNYASKIEFDALNKKIQSLDGQIEVSGSNLNEFINHFLMNNKRTFCENQQIKKNKINNLKFQIKAKTNFGENMLKIHDIIFDLKDQNKINGLIAYDFSDKKIYTNFNAENIDLRDGQITIENTENLKINDIFEKNIDQKIFFIKNYLLFLKKYKSENFFDFKQIIFSDKIKINNFNSEFSSENNNFIIKNFDLKINDIYDLKINNVKNPEELEDHFKMMIKKNQIDFFELNGFFFGSNLIIENFKLKTNIFENQLKEEIIGEIKIKSHDKSNFVFANLVLKNINFNSKFFFEKENSEFQKIFQYFEINKNQTGGDFFKKILFLLEKYNIFYDIKLKFENFNFNSYNLENFELKTFIKNNKITSSIFGQNSLMGKFQINSLLMFKNFKPYFESEINIEKLIFNKFIDEFFQNKILLTEGEFRENNNQNMWRNYNFNFNFIKDLETQIKIIIKNSKINNQEIQNIYSKIKTQNNIFDIEELEIKIDESSNINFIVNLEIEKMLFKGSFETQNFNYQKFFNKQPKSINDQLFLSDINLTLIGKFSTIGQNLDSFIENFNGNIKFYAQNAIFNKIDINNFIDEFDNAKDNNKLISLAEQSVVNGKTIFDEINGDISIRNNIVENIFDFSSKNFNGAGSLNMFLKNFVFKGLLRFAFFSKTNNKNLNFFDLNVNGNFFNINKNIEINK